MANPWILIVCVSILFTQSQALESKTQRNISLQNTYPLHKLQNENHIAYRQLLDVFQMHNKSDQFFEDSEYKFGERIDGDVLVAIQMEAIEYKNKRDVEVLVAYPTTANGDFYVSFVNIFVTQDNEDGNASITKGGIHQTEIATRIKAQNTKFIVYFVEIFGYLKPSIQ
ncbi:uncharacterized protein LOC116341343 [Contarinia nasturtii]|uniref:uncharacterized protein LOC116341343 n=1 Tax=Contarinia nasturtii TaxID=265458 RepID=UPI0012D4121C|nr:uncharacterized protein LOC116341343 [Contarinia nasturtii]